MGHDSPEQNEEAKGRLSSLSICVRLRDARLARGLTLEQLAQLAGITGATVSYIENGKTVPHESTRKAIQDALEARGIVFTNGDKPGFYFDKDKMALNCGKMIWILANVALWTTATYYSIVFDS